MAQPMSPPVPAEANPSNWSIEDSEELYRVPGWGNSLFLDQYGGHLTVSPQGDRAAPWTFTNWSSRCASAVSICRS